MFTSVIILAHKMDIENMTKNCDFFIYFIAYKSLFLPGYGKIRKGNNLKTIMRVNIF